jgi:hypothetical protein
MECKLPMPVAGIMPQSDPNVATAAAGAAVVERGEAVLLDDPQAAAVSATPATTRAG